jgi:hypothetical protein
MFLLVRGTQHAELKWFGGLSLSLRLVTSFGAFIHNSQVVLSGHRCTQLQSLRNGVILVT